MLEISPRRTSLSLPQPSAAFLEELGDAGQRLSQVDWARTPLGPPSGWTHELRMAVRVVLASREPACVWWGEGLANVHNGACEALLGEGDAALGKPAGIAWSDLWSRVGMRIEAALARGEAVRTDPLPFVIEARGAKAEAHFTLSCTPIAGDGRPAGFLCTFADVSGAVLAQRRMAMLHEVAADASRPATVEEACEQAVACLARHPFDLPFAGIYVVDAARGQARLAGACGIEPGHAAMPLEIDARDGAPWPLAEALDARTLVPVWLAEEALGKLPAAPLGRAPREGVLAPLGPVGLGRSAVLVAALNPFLPFGDEEREFVQVCAAQVCARIAAARALDEERRRLEAETLHEVARDIASELELQALLQKVTDAGTRLTGAQFGAFFHNTVDDQGEALRLFTLSGAPREAFERFGMPRATPVFKPTFVGQGPIRVDDITRDPRYGHVEPHRGMPEGHLPVRSYLAVPVIARNGEVLGGLFFGHPQAGVFDSRAERNATGIAAHAAVALDNATLFKRAREEIGRRVAMERDLREGARRYREVVEGLPAAVYTTDAEGRIDLYNESAVAVWGRRPVAGTDRWCGAHRLWHPDGRPMPLDECFMAEVVRTGRASLRNMEVVVERPDGTFRHVLANPRPLHDERGRVVGAVNMLLDVTERKAAEAELAATRDQLARQVDTLTRLHELAMRLGGIAEEAPALRAVLDTAMQAQGADFGLVWLQEPASGDLVVHASRGFDGEKAFLFERVPAGPEGGSAGNSFARGTRWIVEDVEADEAFAPYRERARKAGLRAVHSTPIVTRSGALLGVLSVHFARPRRPSQRDMQIADVCARHAADAIEALRGQEALRESERLYRAIGESIDYGVWITDAEGRGTYTSESFLALLGVTQEQWASQGWERIAHPEDLPPLLEQWRECLRTGRQLDREFRVRCADGRYRSVLGRGVPVRNARGGIVAWAGIHLDIERLKSVENELRELDQRKDEFLATLAHELRNPLAPLRNGLEVMRLASEDRHTVEKARRMMERQLAQMVRLVDDLLDVSRVSRGKIELRREKVELAAVLRNALETSQPLMAERGHELAVEIPAGRIVVDADVTRLSQVFWNLLNNAAKYTEPGGRVELAVRVDGGEAAVSIRDNGIGIPRDMQARVFDIFTQVDRALEKSQGGLGIGLSIAKRLVEMHGGRIAVTSEGHRKGTEFVVRLPAAVEADPPPQAPPANEAPRGPRHRVLVADDNADSAATLSIMLGVMGHEVRVARDGEEAVALAASFRPAAILLDIGMPKLNGYDACERIRAQPWGAGAFIVALTGWGQEEDRARSMAAGFDRHLVKPVEPRALEGMIAGLPQCALEASR